jgi:hypothetical protein
MDALVISKSDRDEVIRELKTQFTLPKKKGDNDPIDVAAILLYDFLNKSWVFKK